MLLRRVIEHVKEQNWTAIALDFVIVVAGVYTAVWIEGLQQQAESAKRTTQIIETLREDLRDSARVEARFTQTMDKGLAQWKADFDAGRMPPPYFFRVPGSETPPSSTWDLLLQMGLGNLLDPPLVFELGFYYSEREGVGRKYLRYIAQVEDRILPLMRGDSSVFYLADRSRLKPEFAASMERLKEWAVETRRNHEWARCLDLRLDAPTKAGKSCTPSWDLDSSGPDAFAIEHPK
ncbi:MAG TPA: hypothetical protein VLB07_03375 [Woeseiaceae bacterium]|nr:hypothetical protein [Woeseiaceae bacterium]